jgi:hypothetical protein
VVDHLGAQVSGRQHTGVALAKHLGLNGREGVDLGERVAMAAEVVEHEGMEITGPQHIGMALA